MGIYVGRGLRMYDDRITPSLRSHQQPPQYDTRRLSKPQIHVFIGDADTLIDKEELVRCLPPCASRTVIPELTHLELLWADGLGDTLHPKILQALALDKSTEIKEHEE